MEVVLRQDVEKVGRKGEITSVTDGFARNFLIPRGLAIVATKGIASQAAAMRASGERVDSKNREAAQAAATKLTGTSVRIEARVGSEGKLFGSVTNAEIVQALHAKGIDIDRRQIELHEPIKSTGEHLVPVKLHTDVRVDVTVEVVAGQE